MTGHILDLIESDVWPLLKPAVIDERHRRLEGLISVPTTRLEREQGFIQALDWVLEAAKPPVASTEKDEE